MAAITWDYVLAFLIGLGGVVGAVLGLYLVVGLSRATIKLLRGDFDKKNSTPIMRGRENGS